jgi:hypothetical protein
MTIDCVYYTPEIRCYRDGVVERLNKNFKPPKWTIVENTDNHGNGYNEIGINDKNIYRHRIIAFCFLGLDDIVSAKGADDCIDHINGNRLDNRVANLKITTMQGNNHNQTRAKGYCWNKRYKKYQAQIYLNKKQIHLGYYNTEEEARQAYLTAKLKYHLH